MAEHTWKIDNEHIRLRCKMDCLALRKKELVANERKVSDQIKHIWHSFGVMVTPQSSMYTSCRMQSNCLSMRYNDCEHVGWLLKAFQGAVDMYQREYSDMHKWYQFIDRYAMKQKIQTHKEDVRLLTLFHNRCSRSDELRAAIEEKRRLDVEINKVSAQMRYIKNEMEYKYIQYFIPIEEVIHDSDSTADRERT